MKTRSLFLPLLFCFLVSTAAAERPNPKHKLQGLCWRIRWGLNRTFTGRDCIKIRVKENDGKPYYLHWCGRETSG